MVMFFCSSKILIFKQSNRSTYHLSDCLHQFTVSVEDWVYLPDQEERQEYVMNEKGKVFQGSGNYIHSMSWDFGQVQTHMNPAAQICCRHDA